MKKHKLLTPAAILGIVGCAFALIAGLSVFLVMSLYQYLRNSYPVILLIFTLLSLGGIFGIIFCSLALGFNKKKIYSKKGALFCTISLYTNAALMALSVIGMLSIAISQSGLKIPAELILSFIVCLLSLIFYCIGVNNSIVGTSEEIAKAQQTINYANNIAYRSVNNQCYASTNDKSSEDTTNTLIETLEKLYNLYQNGVLTQEEYEEKKKIILEKL